MLLVRRADPGLATWVSLLSPLRMLRGQCGTPVKSPSHSSILLELPRLQHTHRPHHQPASLLTPNWDPNRFSISKTLADWSIKESYALCLYFKQTITAQKLTEIPETDRASPVDFWPGTRQSKKQNKQLSSDASCNRSITLRAQILTLAFHYELQHKTDSWLSCQKFSLCWLWHEILQLAFLKTKPKKPTTKRQL